MRALRSAFDGTDRKLVAFVGSVIGGHVQKSSTGAESLERKTDSLSYIIDEPAPEDRFGAHSAITNAILDAIEHQHQIRVVGLLGRWGTGKSTIVSQLSKAIKTRYAAKYALFVYDTWAHQGDPARRSILEELIERLISLKLTTHRKWSKTVADISGATEKTSTTTKTGLTVWGRVFFLMLLLFPLFYAVIDADTVRAVFSDNPDDGVSRQLIIAFLVYMISLALVIIASYVATLDYKGLFLGEGSIWRRISLLARSGQDLMSIMLTRNFPASSSTTMRKSQPTAIEFRRVLRKIVRSQRPKRLIFVVDNLDRIDPEEALEVWSIMIGMAVDEAHRVQAKYEPVVVVPFDPVALQAIIPAGRLEGHSASDLIEKSFDITFEVPPPVMTNWRKYFADQYEMCGLLDWSGNSTFEQYWAVSHFEKLCTKQSEITPRKINRYLNKIISLSKQQTESFGPSILSYYIAHETRIKDNCLEFLKTSNPDFDQTKSWQRKIAAIAYGTTEAEAAQVVLGDELVTVVTNRTEGAFAGLRDFPGFDLVARAFVEDSPRTDSGKISAAPLTALAAFAAEGEPFEDSVFWTRLCHAWERAEVLATDRLTARAIKAFLAQVPNLVDPGIVQGRILFEVNGQHSQTDLIELVGAGDELIRVRGHDDFTLNVGKLPQLLFTIWRAAKADSPFALSIRSENSFEDAAQYVLSRLTDKLPQFAFEDFVLVKERVTDVQLKGERGDFYRILAQGLKETLADVETPDDAIVITSKILADRTDGKLTFAEVLVELEEAGVLSQAAQRGIENNANAVTGTLLALRLTAHQYPSDAEIEAMETWLNATEENRTILLSSIRQMNAGAFLPTFWWLEDDGHNVDRILKPLLLQAVRMRNIGSRAHTLWLLSGFGKAAAWLSPAELTIYAGLISAQTDFTSELQKLADSPFLVFISKLHPDRARIALGERIANFNSDRLVTMLVSADPVWEAYNRYNPDIGGELPANSELAKALVAILSGSAGSSGTRNANRAMKLFPLLSEATQKDALRSSVLNAVADGNVGALLTLTTLDRFKAYLFKPSVAANVISKLFPLLIKRQEGRLFVERNAPSLSRLDEVDADEIRVVLHHMLRSRDPSVVDWAAYVLDKSGLERTR